jgi:hypothetical protein
MGVKCQVPNRRQLVLEPQPDANAEGYADLEDDQSLGHAVHRFGAAEHTQD